VPETHSPTGSKIPGPLIAAVATKEGQPGQRSAESHCAKKRLELAGLRADAALAVEQFGMRRGKALTPEAPMKKQYLHLCVYPCDKCEGPVINGSLAVRESEISKETDIRVVGETCLFCGHHQSKANNASFVRHFLPVEWQPFKIPNPTEVEHRVEPDLVARESK
jgi:hypothetical protein